MSNENGWKAKLAAIEAPDPLPADTYLGDHWGTFSSPVKLASRDDIFVVKALRNGKDVGHSLFIDHVAGILGTKMDVPVPNVDLIDVPKELIESEDDLSHLVAGVAHGSEFLEGVTDVVKGSYPHSNQPVNRPRYASLAILYGWLHASDHQFIYENQEPHRVYSHDHGHFLPGAPNWRKSTLQNPGTAEADRKIVTGCSLSEEELQQAADPLSKLDEDDIAEAIARPPDSWGVTEEERTILAEYLATRRTQLVNSLLDQGASDG